MLLSKSSKYNKQNLAYKTNNDKFLDEIFVQFNIRSKIDSPKGNSQGHNNRSDKIDLKYKTSKENLSNVQTRKHLMNTMMMRLSVSSCQYCY